MNANRIRHSSQLFHERYANLGVNVERALKTLAQIPFSSGPWNKAFDGWKKFIW